MSLTIKQAFEALSDACAAGMKNPFFVMRRLKDSFAAVADDVVDAQGDKVTVTQTLTEGTEIGSIKVNNNTTTLYAPAGSSGHNYSTTEQVVGKWIDGTTDVYEKTIEITALPNNNEGSTAHGISNIGNIISIDGVATSSNDVIPIPYTNVDNLTYQIQLSITAANMVIKTKIDFSAYSGVVILRYTKSST